MAEKMEQITCPYAKKCGGCDYQGMEYDRQLKEKQALVKEHVGRYCGIHPILGMEHPYHYRNKVHAAFDIVKRGAASQKGGNRKGAGQKTGRARGTTSCVPAA